MFMTGLEGPNDGQETDQLNPAFAEEEWTKRTQEMCRKFVGTYRNRIKSAIKNKEYAISY